MAQLWQFGIASWEVTAADGGQERVERTVLLTNLL